MRVALDAPHLAVELDHRFLLLGSRDTLAVGDERSV
jgi:hypothetical protein